MASDRYRIACNGFSLRLQPTGEQGGFIAGVRYRAWQPPRCLHPHIPVHAPLTFDLVDTWMNRSLAGCEYHVAHPGGRSHDTRPVNALEAEGRRRARFFRMGHTQAPGAKLEKSAKLEKNATKFNSAVMKEAEPNVDFPFTLDLRRC